MTDRATIVDDLVDRAALRAYLADHLGPAERFTIERHMEGHSNETLFVDWGERELVLRRPPLGETADSAHDVLREFTVLDALGETPVPVAPTLLACEDPSVIGCQFFVMERCHGDVIRDTEPRRFRNPPARGQLSEEVVETLATIHAVDYQGVGLGEYGHPDGYLGRQVELWRTQLEEWLLPRTTAEREVPGGDQLGSWLASNVPDEADHALVHGDYKLDNLLFGLDAEPTIEAVFDWEMSTLGDPLADLGYLLLFWRDDPEDPDLSAATGAGLPAGQGYHSAGELVAAYEDRTGRAFVNRRFYRALAAYKLATACEAFFLRHLEGTADDPVYPQMEAAVPALVDHGLAIVEGRRPIAPSRQSD